MQPDELMFEGKPFVSARRAADITGYTRDYVGQLARSGKVVARRLGRGWFVGLDSLLRHKSESDSFVPTPPTEASDGGILSEVVTLDGNVYISVRRASEITFYNKDYIGQLARSGKLGARLIARKWYVKKDEILAHKKTQDSILGAQQAASVGIRKESLVRNGEKDVQTLVYSSDDRPLVPPIPERLIPVETSSIANTAKTENPLVAEGKAINTHFVVGNRDRSLLVYKNNSSVTPRPQMSLIIPTVLVAALAIFVSYLAAYQYPGTKNGAVASLAVFAYELPKSFLADGFLASHLHYSR